ncbi:helix-turn-helix domain-containing protein [Actinokineospora auranticolor]|uniref:AcrR family transcriptional regulator n=1 Tax=Actinokineospora auranticolor TaxID=155976 RepID=A0A2S6GIG4_9PSEU|nr:TetR/AcrR family transcriptional regulator [Actinokineospora auranticolor]PPK65028.1 AcrR family transcriptional regulator [Actinokineospora auranticolor]
MRQDARENRERILAAAEDVFGTRGAAGSTEEVAQRAGVGIATVFRHFPTKDALIESALLRHYERLGERARALADHPDPAEAWRALVRALIETGATKLTLAATLSDRTQTPAAAMRAAKHLKTAVGDFLHRAQAAGAVRESVTIDEVYLLIRALAQACATAPTPPDTRDRAITIVLDGLALP